MSKPVMGSGLPAYLRRPQRYQRRDYMEPSKTFYDVEGPSVNWWETGFFIALYAVVISTVVYCAR